MSINKFYQLFIGKALCIALFLAFGQTATADNQVTNASDKNKSKDKIELKTLRIHGNKELPKVLFIVPWQDPQKAKGTTSKQRLVLHSLYGDLFDPIGPSDLATNSELNTINKD